MRRVHVWLVAAAAMGAVLLGVLMLPPAGLAAAATHTGHGKPAAHVRAAVSARGRVAPQALLHHSTSPRPRSAAGKRAQARRPGAVPAQVGPDLGAALPLGSLPLGTYVTNQFEKDGIIFSGQSPFITDDGSSSVNPTISGSPLFQGTVVGTFVKPGTTKPATVSEFALSVGYIDTPDSTQMTVYDSKGNQLGVLVATQQGFNELVSTFPNAASFSVSSVANEPAGWEINTIQVGPINTTYVAMGDSYSSGEGTYDFPWSQSQGTKCDTGPEAWPVQMADAQNSNSTGASLSIGPKTLVACQGELSYQLSQKENGESASEMDQLSNYVATNGPPGLVSLTIGGNDLGFADILRDCFIGGTEACLHFVSSLDNKVTTGANSLIATLAKTYSSIQTAVGPSTQVVVSGYPNLFPQPGGIGRALSVTYHCPWLRESTFGFIFGAPPVSPFVNTLLGNISDAQAALNDDMAVAAAEAGVQFIPIPFSLYGHELCTGTPYINELGLIKGVTGDRNIGHPNVAGQGAIASAVGSQLGLATNGPVPGSGPRVQVPRRARPHHAGPAHPGRNPANAGTLGFSGGPLTDGTAGAAYIGYLVSTGGNGADTWSITSGNIPPGLSLDANAGTITGTPATPGSYTFTAQVTDSSTPAPQTASAPVSIKVDAAASLAVATTQLPDGTVGQPYPSGVAASGGLGAVSWKITAGALPSGLHLDAATGQVAGTPAAAAVGTATFTVQATDSSAPAHVATASESITIHPTSDPLTVTTTTLPEIAAGQDYAGQLASTGGVAPVTWSVTAGSLPPGISLNAATGVLSGTPTAPGTFGFTAHAADATSPAAHTASASLSITIDPSAPLAISTGSVFDGTEGVYYSSTVQAQGGAGSDEWFVSSGSLPAGLSLDPATGQITGTPTGTGTSSFGVTVFDAAGHTATQSYQITVAISALTVSQTLPAATVGAYYTGNITPSGGAAPYGWNLVSGSLPDGLSFDASTGAIVGTPTQSGTFPLTVAVTDSSSPAQQATADVTLNVAAGQPLQVSNATPAQGAVNTPYTTGIGYSGGLGPYTWAITAGTLPPGLGIDPGSGMVTGTPAAAGSYPVTIQVTDSTSPTPQMASAPVTFTIVQTPKLAVQTGKLPRATQGTSYSATLQATGGVAPYTWSLYSGSLPAGLGLDSSGLISGTPTGHGTFGFTVEVTDSAGTPAIATLHYSLVVDKGAPLSVVTTGLDTATQGSPYDESLTAAGGVAPYRWALVAGSKLPAGIHIDPGGFLYGTPTHFGSSTFTLKVTDSATPTAAVAKQVLTLNVEALPLAPPLFTADSPSTPTALHAAYDYQFQASGNPAPTFLVSSGSLPPGLKLAKNGLLSGTPTHPGTYTFEVTATNGQAPDAVTPQLHLQVVPPPVITSFTPAEAVPGAKVVITGKNLEKATYVYFPGSYATIKSDSGTTIVTSVPEYASTGPIYVGTAVGTAFSSTSFTVDPPPAPVITLISPTAGAAGQVLTITGTGLEFAYEVDFNGASVFSLRGDTPTALKVTIPGGISAGPVTVFTDGGSATSSQTFTPTG